MSVEQEDRIKDVDETIVEMLCDGRTKKEIRETLGLLPFDIQRNLGRLRRVAGLPRDVRTYKARRSDILGNLEKYKAYKERERQLYGLYRDSLVRFDPRRTTTARDE
jgi:hypothetical protein